MAEKNVLRGKESGLLSQLHPESKTQSLTSGKDKWLQGEAAATSLAYWQQQLEGVTLNIDLPVARRRPAVITGLRGKQRLIFSETLNREMKDFAESENINLLTIFLAAFHTLLYRYSGQEVIVTGAEWFEENGEEMVSPAGGTALSERVGNILPIRTNLEVVPTFRELLQTLAQGVTEAARYQNLPFEQLSQIIAPQGDRLPLPINFAYYEYPHFPSELAGVKLDSLWQELPGNRTIYLFDLALEIQVIPAGVQGCFSYNGDLFDDSTIEAMAGHFQTLLAAAVADPELNLNQLPMLTAAERELMLGEWNQLKVDYPGDGSITAQFEAQAATNPGSIALICGGEEITYGQLNGKVNQLAHYLQKLGVGPDVPVGVCLERSPLIIIALLAILKAGGVCVPLDPTYPQDRLSIILKDTQLSILLTQEKLTGQLPHYHNSPICLDTQWDSIALESQDNPPCAAIGDNLAYILYTSGSTGKPKGVEMPRSNIWHYVQSIDKHLQIRPDDIYLHTASFSFSSSIRQFLTPLTRGAKLVLATQEQSKNTLKLFELMQAENVTVCDSLQAVWAHGLHALDTISDPGTDKRLPLKLRLLLFSGGLLTADFLQTLREHLEHPPQIINIYGQTETTGNTAYPIPADLAQTTGPVSVGRPLAYRQTYILNSELQPVPIGAIGELHVSGCSLSRGYLNRPDLTQEKYIPNPFTPDTPGAILYKTGDLARYLPDGSLEIIGRTDFQVKIRGMRVETGEIESILLQHPAVKQAVVTARDTAAGERFLAAYYVAAPNQTPVNSELRAFLKEHLPDYMVPAAFMRLEAMPLTANGKLNRLGLPEPQLDLHESNTPVVAPRDDLEAKLAAIWQQVLGIKQIGIQDSFFDLGGHSLLAVELFARIEKEFGKNLILATLLQAPTIAQLATYIRDNQDLDTKSLVVMQPKGTKPPLFCIHAVGGNLLSYKELLAHLDRDQPVYGLQAQGLDGKQPILSKIEDMAALYIQEMKTVQPDGPYFIVGHSFGGFVAFEIAQQLQAAGDEVAFLGLFDAIIPGAKGRVPRQEVLKLHWHGFSENGPAYFLQKLQQKITATQNELDDSWKRLKGKYYQKQGVALPHKIRNLPIKQANHQAARAYKLQPYPGVVTLFRAAVRYDTVAWKLDPLLGWGPLAGGGLQVIDVPGGHESCLKEPYVSSLAAALTACLGKTAI
ncbi:MAG TPA: amino acid adenylation domain-containing protein [Oscillatoriaceae cyanobacterium M33_DOE_052]|nr:amino acid adenylation domain-containing protein [Oscillatoriaceae cyanobacterium M33_DOE_052]